MPSAGFILEVRRLLSWNRVSQAFFLLMFLHVFMGLMGNMGHARSPLMIMVFFFSGMFGMLITASHTGHTGASAIGPDLTYEISRPLPRHQILRYRWFSALLCGVAIQAAFATISGIFLDLNQATSLSFHGSTNIQALEKKGFLLNFKVKSERDAYEAWKSAGSLPTKWTDDTISADIDVSHQGWIFQGLALFGFLLGAAFQLSSAPSEGGSFLKRWGRPSASLRWLPLLVFMGFFLSPVLNPEAGLVIWDKLAVLFFTQPLLLILGFILSLGCYWFLAARSWKREDIMGPT